MSRAAARSAVVLVAVLALLWVGRGLSVRILQLGDEYARADTSAAPEWERISSRPHRVWHDNRTHWMTRT